MHTKANPIADDDDTLRGEGGDDDIMGSAGANELDGGDGNDSIVAGPLNDKDVDRIFGGDGDDEIGAFNPVPSKDIIDCGGGTDRVMADALDEIDSNCEEVEIVQPPDDDMAIERQ